LNGAGRSFETHGFDGRPVGLRIDFYAEFDADLVLEPASRNPNARLPFARLNALGDHRHTRLAGKRGEVRSETDRMPAMGIQPMAEAGLEIVQGQTVFRQLGERFQIFGISAAGSRRPGRMRIVNILPAATGMPDRVPKDLSLIFPAHRKAI